MTPRQIELVQSSFNLVVPTLESAAMTFYDRKNRSSEWVSELTQVRAVVNRSAIKKCPSNNRVSRSGDASATKQQNHQLAAKDSRIVAPLVVAHQLQSSLTPRDEMKHSTISVWSVRDHVRSACLLFMAIVTVVSFSRTASAQAVIAQLSDIHLCSSKAPHAAINLTSAVQMIIRSLPSSLSADAVLSLFE